jgi:D-lactate dehydrogenase (cytochrome)
MAKLTKFPANPAARVLVDTLRQGVIDIFRGADGVHFQVGRAYPLKDGSDPAAWALLGAVKDQLDPDRRMNPGVLGL